MKNITIAPYSSPAYLTDNTTSNSSTSSGHPVELCDFSRTTYKEILLATFLLCVICANIIGNSLVVFASIQSSQLKKRKNIYFIVSLAFSDMGYAVTIIPMLVSSKLHVGAFCHNLATCYFTQTMDVLLNVSSILILFTIAIDRFIAITKPFRYQEIMTGRSARFLVAACWIFAAFWSFIGIFSWGEKTSSDDIIWSIVVSVKYKVCARSQNSYYFATSFIGIYLIPLVIMSVTYGMVLCVAFTQIKAIETTTVEIDTSNSPQPSQDKKKARSQINRRRQKEWKATRSVAVVYLCFFMCWFPLFVINMVFLFEPSSFTSLSFTVRTFIIYTFIDILPSLNTVLNPVIYSFSNKHFRESFKLVCNKIIRKTRDRGRRDFATSRSTTRVMSLTTANPNSVYAANTPSPCVPNRKPSKVKVCISSNAVDNIDQPSFNINTCSLESKNQTNKLGVANRSFDPC